MYRPIRTGIILGVRFVKRPILTAILISILSITASLCLYFFGFHFFLPAFIHTADTLANESDSGSATSSQSTAEDATEPYSPYVYFANYNSQTGKQDFYRATLTDGFEKKLCSLRVDNAKYADPGSLSDSWIDGSTVFYTSDDSSVDSYNLHAFNYATGRDKLLIENMFDSTFQIVDGYIYYFGSDGFIWREKVDGSSREKSSNHTTVINSSFFVYKSTLFYGSDSNNFYRVDLTTHKATQIFTDYPVVTIYGVDNGNLYYDTSDYPDIQLNAYDLNTGGSTQINDHSDYEMVFYGNKIYETGEDGTFYREGTDESDSEELASNIAAFFIRKDKAYCLAIDPKDSQKAVNDYTVIDLTTKARKAVHFALGGSWVCTAATEQTPQWYYEYCPPNS